MANPSNEKVTFAGTDGHTLAARLDRPSGPQGETPRAYALFAHCFTCSKDIRAASRIADGLTAKGIAVLRFDFTGLGASEGEFANTNFSSNVGDLVAAANFMRDTYEAPKILIGHSLGGAAVLSAAGKVPEVEAVVTVNAPADPAHVVENFHCSVAEIEANGEAEVDLAGRTFKIKKQFLDDMKSQKLESDIAAMGKALLVFHTPQDETVSVDNAAAIFAAAKHPKSFVSLDGADHLLSRKEDSAYVSGVIAAWAERYVSGPTPTRYVSGPTPTPTPTPASGPTDTGPTPSAPPIPEDVPAGVVRVAETGENTYGQMISIGGRHYLRADEPVDLGGDDTGGTPYDLLLAGLGACTTITMRMYADLKKLPLDRVSVSLTHAKDYTADCAECETDNGKIDFIERAITLEGDLSDDDRARLMKIADKCPVHKTLNAEVHITTREGG